MDAYTNDKLQYFITPDNTKLIVHSIKNIAFIVVTKDPNYRIIAYCQTKKFAVNRLNYFNKIWINSEYPVMIIKRDSYEYIKDIENFNPYESSYFEPNY